MPFSVDQLAFDLPYVPETGRASFLAGPSNAAALALVDRWPDWPGNAAVIWGPPGAGKSHLCHIWSVRSGADIISAGEISEEALGARLGGRGLAIEAIDGAGLPEPVLFHALNLARAGRGPLLLTSRGNPASIGFRLADLASRLRALTAERLAEPDDVLLRRVMAKLFADRQLFVDIDLIEFLAMRIDRSLAAAMEVVDTLDRAALRARRALSRRFAAEVLGPRFAARETEGQSDLFPTGG